MEDKRISRLTERQKECLRLAYRHPASKEIAPLLGVEPGTVDQHLKAAMKILGVRDRTVAARMLAEAEGAPAYPNLAYQAPTLVLTPADPPVSAPGSEGDHPRRDVVREEQAPFEHRRALKRWPLPVPWRRGGERHNDLGTAQRSLLILALTIGCALALTNVVAVAAMLAELAWKASQRF